MEVYLVGGAVRDTLLGLKTHERDFVVVGATPEMMLSQGYIQVGKDFPVFLHPDTREEYALARTERKSGRGYGGFTVYAAPEVTLEQDLARRDLTINAIAQDERGQLIDPFHGQQDLEKKILRHVTEAFVEDPLRVLRVARFAARFNDFTIAPETLQLMKQIVNQGEMEHLIAQRVWAEVEKALAEQHVVKFFTVLKECGAFDRVFALLAHNQQAFQQGIDNLENAVQHHVGKTIRLAVFLYPFLINDSPVDSFCEQHHVPNQYKNLIVVLERGMPLYQQLNETVMVSRILELLETVDAFRRPQQLKDFLQAANLLMRNTKALNELLLKTSEAAKKVVIPGMQELTGEVIAQKIKEKRLEIIQSCIKS